MSAELELVNVRKKSVVFKLLPWLNNNTATAIYPNVYVPKRIYEDIQKKSPDPYNVALVLHEQEHIKRAKAKGVFRFYCKYLWSREFRFEEELAATVPQFRYIKSHKLQNHLEYRARFLSGWIYFWPVSYEKALRKLQAIWDAA